MFERTLVLLKPDAVRRRLVGELMARFERKGFNIVGLKLVSITEASAREHYRAHRGKEFYEPLVRYVTSGPVVAAVLEGKEAVAVVRRMLGETFGCDSPPGTIRGDFALSNRFNLVHGSDSIESAGREIEMFFSAGDLVACPADSTRWVYDQSGREPV